MFRKKKKIPISLYYCIIYNIIIYSRLWLLNCDETVTEAARRTGRGMEVSSRRKEKESPEQSRDRKGKGK